MSRNNFILILNLSDFFNDHRQRARIFINERIKTVEDLQQKIANCFGINNFVLTSSNEYLPPAEDVRIIRTDDIVCVIPSNIPNEPNNPQIRIENIQASKSSKKRKNSINGKIDNCITTQKDEEYVSQSQIAFVNGIQNSHKKKKKRKENESKDDNRYENSEEHVRKRIKKSKSQDTDRLTKIEYPQNGVEEYSANLTKEYQRITTDNSSEKKSKQNIDSLRNSNKPVQSPKVAVKMDVNSDVSVNVSTTMPNSIAYKKFIAIPTITDEYLRKKKTNAVKIEYVSNTITKVSNNEGEIKENCITSETLKNDDNNTQNSLIPVGESSNSSTEDVTSVASNVPQLNNIPPPILENNDQKKINIIRVDCISKPTNGTHSKEEHETKAVPIIEFSEEVSSTLSVVPNAIEINKSTIDKSDTKVNSDKTPSCLSNLQTESRENNTNSTLLPTTKYLFLNTPSSKEKKEKAKATLKQKKENLFKIRESFWKSPQAEKNQDVQSNLQHKELDKDLCKLERKHIGTKIDEDESLKKQAFGGTQTDIQAKEPMELECIEPYVDENVVVSRTDDLIKTTAILDVDETLPLNEKEKLGAQELNLPVSEDGIKRNENEVREAIPQMISSDREFKETEENRNESDNESQSQSATVSSKINHPVFGKLSMAILQDSFYLSKTSPCIATLEEDSPAKENSAWELSGLNPIVNWSCSHSGVGPLLDSLRSSNGNISTTLNSVYDTSANIEDTNFVTKRKRIRKRKRRPKSKNRTIEETIPPQRNSTPSSLKPLKCPAAPKSHIRFDNKDPNEKEYNEVKGDSEHGDVSVICIDNQKFYEYKNAACLYEWHVLHGLPDTGDVVSFKVLKITDQRTPGISSEIIGTVKEISEDNLITFFIWDGLEELQNNGSEAMSNDQLSNQISPIQTLRWYDLLLPKRGEKSTNY